MIRNIVFDMGMVLLDYVPYDSCLSHAGDPQKAAALKEAIFGHPDWPRKIDSGLLHADEYLTEVQERLETQELKELAAAVLADWWVDGMHPKAGMQQVVEQLLDRGFRLYVLSNCGYCFRQLQYLIPHEEQFSGMLVSAEEKLLKPDPAIFARFCDKFDVRAEECLFIDDLPRNVEGAKAAGMQGYCFADGDVNRLTQFLQQLDA